MSGSYDKIIKENIEALILPIVKKVLGIDFSTIEELPDDFLVTLERKPDFLKKVRAKDENQDSVFHLEFQSNNSRRMDKRMLLYYALCFDIYGLVPKQYVFYIGEEPLNMPSIIEHERLKFSYQIIDIRNFDYRLFLEGETPEEIVIGILGNFGKITPNEVIRQILNKLLKLWKQGKRIEKHLRQLEVLSKLRSLQKQTIDQIKDMPIEYDLTTDVRFLQGEEKGIEKGMEKGVEKVITQILTSDAFSSGKFTLEEVAQMTNTPLEMVRSIWMAMNKKS